GRAHESQCIRFVWTCGGTAFRHGGGDFFSRHAFRRQCWQLEMLRQRGDLKKRAERLASRRSIFERVQTVNDQTRKRQDKWRCTAKYEKNLACDTQHRPLVRDMR